MFDFEIKIKQKVRPLQVVKKSNNFVGPESTNKFCLSEKRVCFIKQIQLVKKNSENMC